MQGLQQAVDNNFPLEAPYCDVDLTPKWDYDFEKAVLLSCGGTSQSFATSEGDDKALALGLGLGLGLAITVLAIVALVLYRKSQNLESEIEVMRKQAAVEA